MKHWSHFLALLTKNLFTWRRRFLATLFEILVPVLLTLVLILIKVTNSEFKEPDRTNELFKIFPYTSSLDSSFSLCSYYQSKEASWGYGIVTNNSFTDYIRLQLSANPTTSNLSAIFFENQEALDSYIQASDYVEKIKLCFVIQVESFSDTGLEFSFRTNSSYVYSEQSPLVGSYIDVFNFYRTETVTEALDEPDPNFLYQYLTSGFLDIISYAGNYVLEKEGIEKEIVTQIKGMDESKFTRSSTLIFIKSLLSLFTYMGYLVPMCQMMSAILRERESRMKELLIVMGISNECYWASWIFYYLCIYTLISILVALMIVTGLYTRSNFFCVFFLFWLFGLFCIFYCQLVSIFFNKAKIAIFMTVVFYLIGFLFSYGLETYSPGEKMLFCFLPWLGLHISLNTLSDLEIMNLGATPNTVNYQVKNLTLSRAYIGLFFASVFLAIAAAYFENIMPSGYKQKKWNFFMEYFKFQSKKKQGGDIYSGDDTVVGEFVENVDPALEAQKKTRQAMVIRGLCKYYGDRKIVENVNLDIYEGQIFALLGHNGSGKTTTISSLIGSIKLTYGEMTIGAYTLSRNIEKIREMIGACLQENILFPLLTPYEHIKIFAIFKQLPLKTITNIYIEEKLAEVKLSEAKETPAEKLSGGQKRKLCLAIALLGESKIVVLDEPTSGMDLNSRRYVWDLLKNNKSQRIIILTTHYMEEADILADRVAMLINGSVRCCGSPLYLKTQFGGGYFLSLLKLHNVSGEHHTKRILRFMKRTLKGTWNVVHDLPSAITFQLPFDFIEKSKGFFQELEERMEDLSLRSYSISVTTLEEVFIRVMQVKAEEKIEHIQKQGSSERFITSDVSLIKGSERVFSRINQLLSLLKKRYITSKRDIKTTLIEVLCPGFFILFTFGMMNWQYLLITPTKLSLDSNLYPQGVVAYNTFPESDLFMSSFNSSIVKESNRTIISDLNPSLYKNLYAGVYFEDVNSSSSSLLNYTLYPNLQVMHSSAFYYYQLTQCTLTDLGTTFNLKINNYPFPQTFKQKLVFSLPSTIILTAGLGIGFGFVPSSIIVLLSYERTSGIKHLHRISGLSIFIYWLGNFIWEMVKQFIMISVTYILIFVTDFVMLQGNSNYAMTCCLILAFTFTSTLFSYFLSFFFKSPGSANIGSLIIHLITGCVVPNLLLIVLNYPATREFLVGFIWILRLFPNFSLNWGILKLSNSIYITTIMNSTVVPNDFGWDGSSPELFMLCLVSIICVLGIIIAELLEHRPHILMRKPEINSNESITLIPDEDVENEAATAQKTNPSEVAVNIKSLFKVYPAKDSPKIAVNNVSFNVRRGECFTILGVNGAGKTSTFKILTGTTAPTSGSVYVHGFDIKTEIDKVRQSLGYCPQNDVLNFALTARETLEMYSNFRGIPKAVQFSTLNKVLELVDLTEHADFACGHYSGGSKRKLCLGIAILGFPELVILDEPTAGMDPESRKKIWKLINELKLNNSAVILTSHSMDEAENVSDRVTIMVTGKLLCLGSPVYIKQKYGDHIELQVKLENPTRLELDEITSTLTFDKNNLLNADAVSDVLIELESAPYFNLINQKNSGSALFWALEKNGGILVEDLIIWLIIEKLRERVLLFLAMHCKQIKIEEQYLTYFKVKIFNQEDLSLGAIFHLIETNKKYLKIAGYSLSQTSLDQIFNKFATTNDTLESKNTLLSSFKSSIYEITETPDKI